MKRALVTLSIDMDPALAPAMRIFAAYAQKYQCDFIRIDQPRFRIRPNLFRKRRVWYHIEKFQLLDYLQAYQRVLFLDADILLHPDCPDLFEAVPIGQLGCVPDDAGGEAWKRTEELRKQIRKCGDLPGRGGDLPGRGGDSAAAAWRYFNSGVMVLDPSHQPLFAMRAGDFIAGRWPEQTLLNYRAAKLQLPIHELPASFNFFPTATNNWETPAIRHGAFIIHYAGQAAKSIMQQDLPHFLNAWRLPPLLPHA